MKNKNRRNIKENILKNMIWLYSPFWKYAKLYVILSLVFWGVILPIHRVLMVIFPEIMLNLLESGESFSFIVFIVVGFQALLLAIPVFEDFYNAYGREISESKVDWKIKADLYDKSLKTDYHYVDDPQYYNTYMWAINHQAGKSKEAFFLINQTISALIIIVSLGTLISSFSPWMVLLTITSMVLRTVGYVKYNQYEVQRESDLMKSNRKLDYFHRIFYMKQYSADIKTTKLKDKILSHFDVESSHKIKIIRDYANKSNKWAVFSDVIYRLFMTIIILCVAYNIVDGNFGDVASYITIMLSIEKMEDSMYQFFELFQQAGKLNLYAKEIRKFYYLESDIELDQGKGIFISGIEAFKIDFSNLCFQYNNSEFKLDHLNLHISKGEKIAIVGENGTGKSTIVKLLLRLYDPIDGKILINDREIKDYNVQSLREKIGVVFQDTNIYSLTLKENMELYRDVEEKEADSLIEKVQLRKMLIKNSASLESIMTKEFDDSGIICSVGERQKIGWTRVLKRDFGLLILDEPSSALDPLAEYEMSKLLYDKENAATMIIVAHRLSTIRNMDRIIVMNSGKIVEVGKHEELMEKKGYYYDMFTRQAENYQ